MFLILTLLLGTLQPPRNAPNPLVGTWLNQNPSTMGVTHIVVSDQRGVVRAHAWGACVPSDCDWGVEELRFADGVATILFDMGPIATTMYVVHLPNDKLLAVFKSQLKDGSHSEPDYAEIFVREQEAHDAATTSAKHLLRTVAETYRELPSAKFESEEIINSGTRATATRTRTLVSPPDKWRVETYGTEEPTVRICDGRTVWSFFPESDEYTAYAAGKRESPNNSYTFIDQFPGSPKIIGSEHLADRDTIIVTISRLNQTRTLWVDAKTNFIRKDETTNISATTGTVQNSMTTIYSVADVAADVDERLFSFDPQRLGAKSRTELRKEVPAKSIGTPAPDFTLSNLDQEEVALRRLQGKVVLLNFWATWCVPCRSEMPTIELLYREFKDKGLVVLGINDEELQTQASFLKKYGFSFASLIDTKMQVSNLYRVGGIPTTVLIDRHGNIKVYDQGSASYESLRETLQEMCPVPLGPG